MKDIFDSFETFTIVIFAVIYIDRNFNVFGMGNAEDLVIVNQLAYDITLNQKSSKEETRSYLLGYMDAFMRTHPEYSKPQYQWEFYDKWSPSIIGIVISRSLSCKIRNPNLD